MKHILTLLLIINIQLANAQYLNGNEFNFDIATDNILEVYYKEISICEIDIENEKIINDFYWFENGNIYEIDTDYEQIIGKYSKNEITIFEESYKLEKPIFSKMRLKKNKDSKFEIKIACQGNKISINEKHHQISDVLKLWIIMKGAERLIQREKTTNSILNSIQIN